MIIESVRDEGARYHCLPRYETSANGLILYRKLNDTALYAFAIAPEKGVGGFAHLTNTTARRKTIS